MSTSNTASAPGTRPPNAAAACRLSEFTSSCRDIPCGFVVGVQDRARNGGHSAGSNLLSSASHETLLLTRCLFAGVHIVLREAGIEAELILVDLASRTTAAGTDFTRINPRGYVPVLELPNGEYLSESAAILQYLADIAPRAELAPAHATLQRYRVQEWLSYGASELLKTMGPLFNPALHDGTRQGLIQRLMGRLDWAEAQLADQHFVLGDRYSVADAYLFALTGMLRVVGLNLADWPALAAHSARVAGRPAVQAALRAEGPC